MAIPPLKRARCVRCERPLRNCICHLVQPLSSRLSLGILQHPLERNQAKGTAKLAHLCLAQSRFWLGESCDDLADFQAWLQAKPTYLLYPATATEAVVSTKELVEHHPLSAIQVLVLDGTWRKTAKLLHLNPMLAALPKVALQTEKPSAYVIRKAAHAHQLSTLEAIASLLSEMESPELGETLEQVFERFIQQQQDFMPPSV